MSIVFITPREFNNEAAEYKEMTDRIKLKLKKTKQNCLFQQQA